MSYWQCHHKPSKKNIHTNISAFFLELVKLTRFATFVFIYIFEIYILVGTVQFYLGHEFWDTLYKLWYHQVTGNPMRNVNYRFFKITTTLEIIFKKTFITFLNYVYILYLRKYYITLERIFCLPQPRKCDKFVHLFIWQKGDDKKVLANKTKCKKANIFLQFIYVDVLAIY